MYRKAIIVMAMWILGCIGSTGVTTEPGEADHEALRALLRDVTAAINAYDIGRLDGLLTKEFSFTTSDQSVLTSRQQMKEYWDTLFNGDMAPLSALKLEPEADILTTFLNDTTGICRGHAKEAFTLASGEELAFDSAWTAVVVKEDGKWKLSTVHAGIHFFENPVITKLRAAGKTMAVGSALVGGVIGFLIARFFPSRKPS